MGTDKERKAIKEAIAKFPPTFGLRAFPGDTFRIGEHESYFSGQGECGPPLMLYTQRLSNGVWVDFAKGTTDALMREIVKLK